MAKSLLSNRSTKKARNRRVESLKIEFSYGTSEMARGGKVSLGRSLLRLAPFDAKNKRHKQLRLAAVLALHRDIIILSIFYATHSLCRSIKSFITKSFMLPNMFRYNWNVCGRQTYMLLLLPRFSAFCLTSCTFWGH